MPFSIVGVVADSKYTNVREQSAPMAYFPVQQLESIGAMHVELRTQGDPKLLLPAVQKTLVGIAPDLAPLQAMTQQEQFDASISDDRLIARLAMCFGLLAVVLVATGLYGTITYSVSRRTPELGIRMALGRGTGASAANDSQRRVGDLRRWYSDRIAVRFLRRAVARFFPLRIER